MIEMVREIQIPLLAGVLLAAGSAKLLLPGDERRGAGEGRPPVLTLYRRETVVTLGALELVLGAALLITPAPAFRIATGVGFAAATWVVGELRARRPDLGCGCFGGLSTTRAGKRAELRAGLLTACALATLGVPATGAQVLGRVLGLPVLLIAAEVAVLLAISPEVGVLLARRRLPPVPCAMRRIPVETTLEALYTSAAWHERSPMIVGTAPSGVWREECLRFLVFAGWSAGMEFEVVFAVSLEDVRHPEVRTALVPVYVPAASDTEDTRPSPFVPVHA
jgi:hypothetical protein